MLKKTLFTAAILGTLVLGGIFVFARPVLGAIRCETQYGGGQVCVTTGDLQINKKVFNPDTKEFVDNLGLNVRNFNPGGEIIFKLIVKNVGSNRINNIHVTDFLPDSGFFVLSSGSLTYDINGLDAGASDERTFNVKVVSADKLPKNEGIICDGRTINAAEVRAGDNFDRDTAAVCVEKKVLGAKVLPVTGSSTLPAFAFLLAFAAGLILTKKAPLKI